METCCTLIFNFSFRFNIMFLTFIYISIISSNAVLPWYAVTYHLISCSVPSSGRDGFLYKSKCVSRVCVQGGGTELYSQQKINFPRNAVLSSQEYTLQSSIGTLAAPYAQQHLRFANLLWKMDCGSFPKMQFANETERVFIRSVLCYRGSFCEINLSLRLLSIFWCHFSLLLICGSYFLQLICKETSFLKKWHLNPTY